MEFVLIKDGYKHFYATPVFARINPFTKEDLYYNNIRYMIYDAEAKKLQWVCSITDEVKMDSTGMFYSPSAKLVRDGYLPDTYPWIISEDIAHGVHYNGILGDVFAGFSVENDGDYQKLLGLTDAITADVLEKCSQVCAENVFPEWHKICNGDDARNLFLPTRNLSCSSFTDVVITEEKIVVKISSKQWGCDVELVFEDEPKASKSVLKSPMAKWAKFWFIFDGDTVYLVNNEDIDSVDEIKSTTKYFCGNTVTYKITPTM